MFGRARRAAARDHAQRDARAQAEADALFAEADRLDDLTGQPFGYRQQMTAGRAARIRELLGPDVRDARGAAAEARLQGGELDAEIDLLAEAYPEPSWTPESPFASGFASGLDAPADPDHLYGSPECAEAESETAHFGRQAGRAADAGRFPLPRILPASEVSPVRAPVAATLPDGTPHADPFLAGGAGRHKAACTSASRRHSLRRADQPARTLQPIPGAAGPAKEETVSQYTEGITAEDWRDTLARADEAVGGRDTRIRMDTALARQLGLSRPWVSGPSVGRCPGSGEYGHGMSLTTVHGDCCQAWDQARAQAVRSAQAEAGS